MSTNLARLRLPALVLASGGFLTVSAGSVDAQGGFGDLFGQLFGGGSAPRSAQPAPAYNPNVYQPGRYRARREARSQRRPAPVAAARETRPESRPASRPLRTRYAALPKADPVKDDPNKIIGKQPVDQEAIAANPTGALLRDATLRSGDIVVMKDGPKVFKGEASKRHRMSDFEDIKNSRLVGKKTRQQLVAMMVPVGAMPAHEARKTMAKLRKLANSDEIESVRAETAQPLRVIIPWSEKQ